MTKHVIVNSKSIDILAVLMLMSTIMLVGTSRLRASIWAYAIRSFLLVLVSGLIAYFSGIYHIFIDTGISLALKVIVIPRFLFYIVDKTKVKTEVRSITQILGLLAMEDGIFLAALSTCYGMPLLVELGIFFDILQYKNKVTNFINSV